MCDSSCDLEKWFFFVQTLNYSVNLVAGNSGNFGLPPPPMMPPPAHVLLQYDEFVRSDSFYPFWKSTWGKLHDEVFDSAPYKGMTYEFLFNLPPKESNPVFISTSGVECLLVLSEYKALWTDLQNELNGKATGLPTQVRSDPSPWDRWNEFEGKPWSDGFYRNEDGTPVADILDLQLQSNNDAQDDDEELEALKRRKRQKRTEQIATFKVFQILGQPGIGTSHRLQQTAGSHETRRKVHVTLFYPCPATYGTETNLSAE
jgi:hypothetical protein